MATFDLKGYARRGAEARLTELREEMEAIYGAFPDLREMRRGAAAVQNERTVPKAARKRRGMTAAQRKAVGERMRKYWAAKRAEAGSKKR